MLLYANGDSHTAPDFGYVNIVAQKFDCDLINQAQLGSSNASILRRTREYLEHTTPNFIIIGWSTWEREEWYHNDRYYTVTASGTNSVPEELANKYKQWVTEQTSDRQSEKSVEWHEYIYSFHLELEQKNIRHLFFNCMYDFIRKNQTYNWNSAYVDPYDRDQSFYWYLKNKGLRPDEWYHYEADGHKVWAEFLIDYIRENKLI
tara:strand:+ start:312 stop:923 length:612 start_codon:yes stop_codon:yes gene_type:complete